MGSLLVNDTAVKECLEILNSCLKSKTPIEVSATLERLNSGLSKSLESRMHAFQTGACGLILDVLDDFVDVKSVVRSCLKALVTLSSQSNELNEKGIARQMNLLQEGTSAGNSRLVMRWMKRCCLKSEKNRQAIFEAGVTDRVKEILQKDTVTAGELSDLCSLLRALILDDDLTIDYGNSVQRTRDVAQETVIFVVPLLAKFIHKKKTVCEVLKTLTALLVRNDFCVKVEEIGGVSLVLQTTVVHPDDENLTCLVLRLIKRLAGNDYVKVRLVVEGAASLVVSAMRRMQTGSVSVAGLDCIGALTLGSWRNAGIFYDCEAALLIIETMKRYPGSVIVQRNGTRAISNMARSRKIDARRAFLDLGVEAVLETAMKIHADDGDIGPEVTAAFSALELHPALKDHWAKMPAKKLECGCNVVGTGFSTTCQ